MTRLSLYQPFGVSYVLLFPFVFIPVCFSVWDVLLLCFCILRLKLLCHACVCLCVRSVQINVCSECLQDGLWLKQCFMCIILYPDSQRYRTDVNPLMRPSGLDSLFEEGESLTKMSQRQRHSRTLQISNTYTNISTVLMGLPEHIYHYIVFGMSSPNIIYL